MVSMGLRSVYTIVLAVTLSFLSTNNSCQDSGIGTLALLSLGFQQFHVHQKFNSDVPANTFVDQWDGSVPFAVQFSQEISLSGYFKPAAGHTLPVTTYAVQPWLVCPGKTMPLPTVPPVVTIPVRPDLTFGASFPIVFPVCSGHTTPGINTLLAGSHVQFSTAVNGDAPAGTIYDLNIHSKF